MFLDVRIKFVYRELNYMQRFLVLGYMLNIFFFASENLSTGRFILAMASVGHYESTEFNGAAKRMKKKDKRRVSVRNGGLTLAAMLSESLRSLCGLEVWWMVLVNGDCDRYNVAARYIYDARPAAWGHASGTAPDRAQERKVSKPARRSPRGDRLRRNAGT